MNFNNPNPDLAQHRRDRIAEQHPDAPGVSSHKDSFLESVSGSFWQVAKEITSAQIEAARKAEEAAEARRSKWADKLQKQNPHEP